MRSITARVLSAFHRTSSLGQQARNHRAILAERIDRGPTAALDPAAHVCVGLSALLHVAVVGGLAWLSAQASVDAEAVSRDRVLLMTHYLHASAERVADEPAPAEPPKKTPPSRAAEVSTGSAAGREEAHEEAARFGIIGMLDNRAGAGDPAAPVAPWGREESLGHDGTARGNMWGEAVADATGVGGLGLAGVGGGGGGRPEGIGMGSGGTLGRGARVSELSAMTKAAPQYVEGLGVKAGEWDDNANYRDFQRYLANEETLPIRPINVQDRHFLVVRDADGKAVPDCRVTVSDGQREVTLTTTLSGRAIFFPHAEQVDGQSLSAAANCAGARATAHFSLADRDGVIDLKLASQRELPAVRTIDVAFVLDTTGSMSEEISAVRLTILRVGSSLRHANVRVRMGLVEYKDRGDPFVTKVHPMSSDAQAFLAGVAGLEASGGGDTPESVNEGLHVALQQMAWGQNSIGRFAFLLGDAPPHLDYPNSFDYAVDVRDAAHRGIQVFTIAASGMDALGQAVWRQIAQYTGATNMFVLRGGAGPQSVGAGDPKSSCGGTQTQYVSGNLDTLILAKINRELQGLERDPLRIPGLNVDESAKPCNERLALD